MTAIKETYVHITVHTRNKMSKRKRGPVQLADIREGLDRGDFILATGPERKRYKTTSTQQYQGRFATANSELKFFETDFIILPIPQLGVVPLAGTINNITQGVTEQNRIGRKCVIRRIEMLGTVGVPEYLGVTPPNSDTTRIIVVLDRQCNGATATVAGDDGPLHVATWAAFWNLCNQGRFVILADHWTTFNYNNMTEIAGPLFSASEVQRPFKLNKKVNIPVEFVGSTGAIGTIRSNNIFVVAISRLGEGNCNIKVRVRFSDG